MRTLLLMRGIMGSGKAQPLTSKILKTNGEWILMKDIKVGDEIFDGLGNPTKVIGVYPQGLKDVYELITYDNRKCLASSEHLWKVRNPTQIRYYNNMSHSSKEFLNFNIMTTTELIEEFNEKALKSRCRLPLNKCIQSPHQKVKIPPYLLGALIGDGNLSNKSRVYFCNTELDIINKVKTLIETTYKDLTLRKSTACSIHYSIQHKENGLCKSHIGKQIIKDLNYYNLMGTYSHTKFIPKIYLKSSRQQRLELLKGLMDTDGTVTGNSYRYSTVSKQLKDDIVYLCRSLGFVVTVCIDKSKDIYKHTGCKYILQIQTRDIIVSSEKHLKKFKGNNKKYYSHNYIKNIEYKGKMLCQCIKVDSKDETYITDDFIVTHNTTWIKENNLKQYTLETDSMRIAIQNPILSLDGDLSISQQNDRIAWNMLYSALEERMKEGHFTIIDATHINPKWLKNYEKLAEKYRYRLYYYETETSLEQSLEWNKNRPVHKIVPEEVIKNAFNQLNNNPMSKKYERIYDISEISNYYIADANKYQKIKVAGDIHSCGTVLEEYLKDFNEDTLYVFVGDYFDRGIEHKKTWEILKELYKKENIVLLEGNHEKWLNNFANDEEELSRAAKKTFEDITENLSEKEIVKLKKEMRKFMRKLRQCFAFEFKGQKYLVTHGGLSAVPNLLYISTNEMIKGIGNYETEIDQIYSENFIKGKCQDFIQIHGHRKTESTEHSYCLEDEIEFGGNLKYAEITEKGLEIKTIKNDIYDKNYLQNDFEAKENEKEVLRTEDPEINTIINSKLVKVRKCEPNTYSLNFVEKAFRRKLWDSSTIKARGLFVDRNTGSVVSRAYDKFFNYNETGIPEVSEERLKETLKFPFNKKNEEFIISTKGTTYSDYVNIFRKIFEKIDKNIKNCLKKILLKHNCSVTFEVISSLDPHIVKYEKTDMLYLLDFVENILHINGKHIDNTFSDNMKQLLKEKMEEKSYKDPKFEFSVEESVLNSWEEFQEFYKNTNDIENIEGYVIKDQNGFMFKLKNNFYTTWKRRRNILNHYQNNIEAEYDLERIKDNEDGKFAKWLINLPKEEVKNKNIIEIREKYNSR